jgi:hypothetical protein
MFKTTMMTTMAVLSSKLWSPRFTVTLRLFPSDLFPVASEWDVITSNEKHYS